MAKSYYEEQIARARKTLADAAAGKGFAAAVKQLQDRARIKDSLKDLPARGAIVSKRVIGRRSGSASSSGAVRTEQSRSYFTTVRELRSSDGLFLLQYRNVEAIVFAGETDRYLDFDPSTLP
jgi:hypothetical protein